METNNNNPVPDPVMTEILRRLAEIAEILEILRNGQQEHPQGEGQGQQGQGEGQGERQQEGGRRVRRRGRGTTFRRDPYFTRSVGDWTGRGRGL